MKRKSLFIILTIIILMIIPNLTHAQTNDKVYVIPIDGEINRATKNFVKGVLKDLEGEDVDAIIFEINTFGGLIEEAREIRDLIIKTDIPTIAFVNNKAGSAGVLITIASEKVVMSTSAMIGSAEPIPNTEKILSMWRSWLRDTANYRGRNSQIIEAMADKVKGVSEAGKLVNLTSKEALELGIADYISNDYNDIAEHFGYTNSEIIKENENLQVKLSKYISNPYLSSMLLTIAFVGLVVEVFTPGFGVGGTISIIGFGLYFGGNILAGNSNWTSLALFIVGLILLIVELMIPGFGLPGISGIIFVIIGVILAMDSVSNAIFSISIAIIITTIVGIILVKRGFESKLFKSIVLDNKHEKEKGYISSETRNHGLINKNGIAASDLKPSGFIDIDGERFDSLSDDGYIPKGTAIVITRIEGSKIFVRRM
mgnify:CR=1 FL=1